MGVYMLSHRHFQSSFHEPVSFELKFNSSVLFCGAKGELPVQERAPHNNFLQVLLRGVSVLL